MVSWTRTIINRVGTIYAWLSRIYDKEKLNYIHARIKIQKENYSRINHINLYLFVSRIQSDYNKIAWNANFNFLRTIFWQHGWSDLLYLIRNCKMHFFLSKFARLICKSNKICISDLSRSKVRVQIQFWIVLF